MRTLLPLAALLGTLPAAALATGAVDRAAGPSAILPPAERAAYRTVFAAIRSGDLASASAALDALPGGMLTPVARAELLLAPGSPLPDPAALTALLATAPDLPEAPALAALARGAGAVVPLLPPQRALIRLAGASKRMSARPTRQDSVSASLAAAVQPLLKTNDATAAEPLIEAAAAQLAPDALAEWRQRLAWAYLLGGDDANARRVALSARAGSGDWAVLADWTLGLASWRAGDAVAAGEAFASVAARARDPEMVAGGLYWAARADTAAGRPERVAARLRTAARLRESFYGMLAARQLGISDGGPAPLAVEAATPNARAAAALVEVGETALADRLLRYQARIGAPAQHGGLVALAARLNLPATQVWLAQNGPSGAGTTVAARYPQPGWAPAAGWRVDRALCLAHALQESQFRADAVSRAGARGLMQLMPGTARLVARHKGEPAAAADRLNDPAYSFEYGQSYLEELAGHGGTQGLLPKVIAAYNAGPGNVALWNLRDGAADPLFFIETIPFAETRGYVATVLRNYWMYQHETGAATDSLTALAEAKWPRFPRAAAATRLAYDTGAAADGSN